MPGSDRTGKIVSKTLYFLIISVYIYSIILNNITMLRFSDGITIDTSGPPRTLTLWDGHYVVGAGQLIPVKSLEEAEVIISNMHAI